MNEKSNRCSMQNRPAVLQVEHLQVQYGCTPILWDICLQIPQGVCVGILGPNGAGKSTLIKACLGLIPGVAGVIKFFGKNLNEVRQRVAYVPQRTSVDWDFPITVRELVLMGCYARLGILQAPREADIAALHRVLEVTGLQKLSKRQIGELSGGQQQRAFLARALMQEADIYLMDEPFVGVDHATEKVLVELLHQLMAQGKTVVIVHHDLATVERYFDWLVLLNTRLVAQGPVQKVFTKEMLQLTYGTTSTLFTEAATLQAQRSEGDPASS